MPHCHLLLWSEDSIIPALPHRSKAFRSQAQAEELAEKIRLAFDLSWQTQICSQANCPEVPYASSMHPKPSQPAAPSRN